MTRREILAKLEDIVQNGGSIAELNACKALLALPEYAVETEKSVEDPFDSLDGDDELGSRRARRAA